MKLKNLTMFLPLLFFIGCYPASGYDTYVNENIRPLRISGLVLDKYKEETGCFGAIIIKDVNSIDTVKNIFTCADGKEKIWDYVQPQDSIYKNQDSLSVFVIRNGYKTDFIFPSRD